MADKKRRAEHWERAIPLTEERLLGDNHNAYTVLESLRLMAQALANADTSPSREEELEAKNQDLLDNLNNAAETNRAFVVIMTEQQKEIADLKKQVEEAKALLRGGYHHVHRGSLTLDWKETQAFLAKTKTEPTDA